MKYDQWWNLYNKGWGDELVPEAYSHPAKVAPNLSKRIYDHAIEEGWLSIGNTVLDPFGGIAGFGLQAMAHGLTWVGIELEQKFVDLGNQNISLWNRKYSQFSKWGSAVLLQGDSRNLIAIIEENKASGVISSPPFAEAQTGGGISASMRGEGTYNVTTILPRNLYQPSEHGSTPGNLGNLRATEEGFSGAISSPPYESSIDRHAETVEQVQDRMRRNGFSESSIRKVTANSNDTQANYNRSNSDNIGNFADNDFWQAAKTIVQQTYSVLNPNAHAIWVLKQFVRNRQIVDFPDQWRQLCESVGFTTVHEHHAMLISEVEQTGFFGNSKRTERKSFFRRLAESKGSPRIDFEVVMCQVKLT